MPPADKINIGENTAMKKITAAVCFMFLLFSVSAVQAQKLTLFADEPKFNIDGQEYILPENILLYYSNIYMPIDNILKASGFDLGWNGELRAVEAIKDGITSYILMDSNVMWVGEERCEFELPTLIYHGVAYMSQAMYQRLTGFEVELGGVLAETKFNRRDTLLTTYPGDLYRYENWGISSYGGFAFINNKHAMELLSIPEEQGRIYANLVNMVTNSLPDVQVYAIMVPNYAEFYAPKEMAMNQTAGIRTAYGAMQDNVMPINTVAALYAHGNEKLYFDTDHHWTQRGAYYAYQAFAENKGWDMPALDTYECFTNTGFVGSVAGFARGTRGEALARQNGDLMEKFMPKSRNYAAASYADQNMCIYEGPVQVVNPKSTGYSSAFLGGDCPLTVIVNPDARTNRKLVILKESFGNAFTTWAVDDYAEIYAVDPRKFNGFGGNGRNFDLKAFYEWIRFDDLIMINYPGGVTSVGYRQSVADMVK